MKIKPLQINTWSKLGMEKAFFGIGMLEVAKQHSNLCVITADLCGYSGMERLQRYYPNDVVNVGIQEQNMLGVACGMALEGKLVYAGSYSAFAVGRAMEQVRHNMSVLNNNIKLVGYSSGYSKGTLGRSHWATEDIAWTRCLPNLTVISVADSLEAVKASIAVADTAGPVYIRLCGGSNCPIVYPEDYNFQIGKAIKLHEGSDTVIFATGRMVYEAILAAKQLELAGISAEVYNVHTLKPIDSAVIEEKIRRYRHVYTIEEHNVIGGLGSAVAEIMSGIPSTGILHRLGMQDTIYDIGSERYIWQQAGICSEQIAENVKNTIGQ